MRSHVKSKICIFKILLSIYAIKHYNNAPVLLVEIQSDAGDWGFGAGNGI